MIEEKVESAQYVIDMVTEENISISAVIDGKTWQVPLDPNNTHYIAITKWVAEGNTIKDAD